MIPYFRVHRRWYTSMSLLKMSVSGNSVRWIILSVTQTSNSPVEKTSIHVWIMALLCISIYDNIFKLHLTNYILIVWTFFSSSQRIAWGSIGTVLVVMFETWTFIVNLGTLQNAAKPGAISKYFGLDESLIGWCIAQEGWYEMVYQENPY